MNIDLEDFVNMQLNCIKREDYEKKEFVLTLLKISSKLLAEYKKTPDSLVIWLNESITKAQNGKSLDEAFGVKDKAGRRAAFNQDQVQLILALDNLGLIAHHKDEAFTPKDQLSNDYHYFLEVDLSTLPKELFKNSDHKTREFISPHYNYFTLANEIGVSTNTIQRIFTDIKNTIKSFDDIFSPSTDSKD